jgi:DNA modification methylase
MTTEPVLRHRSDLTGSEVWEGDARQVAAAMVPGSCSLAILDGPYAMQKAAWDRMKVADLPEWYRPHLEDVDRVCGPSASLYLWNTAEGWAAVHPVILSMGWTFRALVVWVKEGAHPARIGAMGASRWPDVTEVAGHYSRGEPYHQNAPGVVNVWPFDSTNQMRASERLYQSETMRRPGGDGRYYDCRAPLHPCQKPLLFAERMIRASTCPGESVWAPFGGTLREAVAAERIARADPAEARRVITAELNQDGVDYIGPALRQLQGLGTRRVDPRQATLFGGGR